MIITSNDKIHLSHDGKMQMMWRGYAGVWAQSVSAPRIGVFPSCSVRRASLRTSPIFLFITFQLPCLRGREVHCCCLFAQDWEWLHTVFLCHEGAAVALRLRKGNYGWKNTGWYPRKGWEDAAVRV